MFESDISLVFQLSFLQGLFLLKLVDLHIVLFLFLVIFRNMLELLTTEGTFQVVNSLSCDTDAIIELVLLLLKLGQLHGTKTVTVEFLGVNLVDIDTLDAAQFLKLLLQFLLANTVLFILETLLLTLTMFIQQSLLLGFLELLGADSLASLFFSLLAL